MHYAMGNAAPESGGDSEQKRDEDLSQDTHLVKGRHRIRIDEFWGTLLDQNGQVMYQNCVCTVAAGKFMIRPPVANPLWHGESPFVVAPLVRVPHTVWHEAMV